MVDIRLTGFSGTLYMLFQTSRLRSLFYGEGCRSCDGEVAALTRYLAA